MASKTFTVVTAETVYEVYEGVIADTKEEAVKQVRNPSIRIDLHSHAGGSGGDFDIIEVREEIEP